MLCNQTAVLVPLRSRNRGLQMSFKGKGWDVGPGGGKEYKKPKQGEKRALEAGLQQER